MTRMLTIVSLSLALLTASLPVQPTARAAQQGPGYQKVSPAELQALLAQEDPFLLDVHVPNEGYLAGTDARLPYTDVAARAAELPADREARIVVYCMTGRMSAIAAAELVRLGYRNVLDLDGGMVAWRAAGYDLLPE